MKRSKDDLYFEKEPLMWILDHRNAGVKTDDAYSLFLKDHPELKNDVSTYKRFSTNYTHLKIVESRLSNIKKKEEEKSKRTKSLLKEGSSSSAIDRVVKSIRTHQTHESRSVSYKTIALDSGLGVNTVITIIRGNGYYKTNFVKSLMSTLVEDSRDGKKLILKGRNKKDSVESSMAKSTNGEMNNNGEICRMLKEILMEIRNGNIETQRQIGINNDVMSKVLARFDEAAEVMRKRMGVDTP